MVIATGIAWYVSDLSRDLPNYDVLAKYEPPVMTRVHAADGQLVAEYAQSDASSCRSRPSRTHEAAFLSAEDKNFYQHAGLDYYGIARAMLHNVQARQGPAPGRRLDDHPAGGEELPPDRRADRSSARSRRRCWRCASSRPSPRTRSSSSISTKSSSASAPTASPPRRCNYFDKSLARADAGRGGLSRRPSQGAEQLPSVPLSPSAPSSGATG